MEWLQSWTEIINSSSISSSKLLIHDQKKVCKLLPLGVAWLLSCSDSGVGYVARIRGQVSKMGANLRVGFGKI